MHIFVILYRGIGMNIEFLLNIGIPPTHTCNNDHGSKDIFIIDHHDVCHL